MGRSYDPKRDALAVVTHDGCSLTKHQVTNQGSYPIRESKFPDYSLNRGQKHPLFPEPPFTYLQKEVKKIKPNQ